RLHAHHHGLLRPALRLDALRLRRLDVLLRGLGVRSVQGHGRLASAQHLSQLRPELLVLLDQPVELRFDLIEEGVDLFLVVARPEPRRAELLVPHIRGRQWHVVSLAHLDLVPVVASCRTLPDQISCTAWNNTNTTRNSTMKLRSKATVPRRRVGM